VHFGLISPSGSHVVALISGLELVSICATVACSRCLAFSCSLKITFGYVPRFVSTFSCSRVSDFVSALTLPRALAINLVPDFVFTFACTRSGCSLGSLFAGLA
jgi:hypothetical protein